MKKLGLMTFIFLALSMTSVLAQHDVKVTISVVHPLATVGLFSVGLFATIMGAGFLLAVVKMLYVDNTNGFVGNILTITIMCLVLVSAVGILFSL